MGDGDEGAKVPEIVVDNTHTQLWEFSGYVQIAEAFGYEVEIVRMDTPVDVAASRNLHGVPLKAVQSMADRFQKVLPWWKETVVKGI
jgi:predicted kinase